MAVLHKQKVRFLLPAETYDLLELAADANGGVGAGMMYLDPERQEPLCPHGLLEFARGKSDWKHQKDLLKIGLTPLINDVQLADLLSKPDARVSFPTWCRRLAVGRAP
jgi:hypothetical protein